MKLTSTPQNKWNGQNKQVNMEKKDKISKYRYLTNFKKSYQYYNIDS